MVGEERRKIGSGERKETREKREKKKMIYFLPFLGKFWAKEKKKCSIRKVLKKPYPYFI